MYLNHNIREEMKHVEKKSERNDLHERNGKTYKHVTKQENEINLKKERKPKTAKMSNE